VVGVPLLGFVVIWNFLLHSIAKVWSLLVLIWGYIVFALNYFVNMYRRVILGVNLVCLILFVCIIALLAIKSGNTKVEKLLLDSMGFLYGFWFSFNIFYIIFIKKSLSKIVK
jgi:peptidoglycan/LPS O-acetylase OafA/YrhL